MRGSGRMESVHFQVHEIMMLINLLKWEAMNGMSCKKMYKNKNELADVEEMLRKIYESWQGKILFFIDFE